MFTPPRSPPSLSPSPGRRLAGCSEKTRRLVSVVGVHVVNVILLFPPPLLLQTPLWVTGFHLLVEFLEFSLACSRQKVGNLINSSGRAGNGGETLHRGSVHRFVSACIVHMGCNITSFVVCDPFQLVSKQDQTVYPCSTSLT